MLIILAGNLILGADNLSSILCSKREQGISTLTDLLLYFWKLKTRCLIYFVFQILFNEL